MKELLEVASISRQALSQHFKNADILSRLIEELLILVDEIRKEHPGCGLEKIYYTIKPDWIGRDRFINLCIGLGYRVRIIKNYTRTTFPGCYNYINCIEGMVLWDKNQLWQSDISYFRVKDEFCYLVFITDVYTKQIIGYQASNHMRASANMNALLSAMENNPVNLSGLIHHSDRGSQYGEKLYVRLLESHGIIISMAGKATENAYAERVNGIIKNEFLSYMEINSLDDLKRRLSKSVNYYNSRRIHLALPGRTTPNVFANELKFKSLNERKICIVFSEKNPEIYKSQTSLDIINDGELPGPRCLIN